MRNLVLLPLLAACTFEENLEQVDLHGTLRIPVEAVRVTLQDSSYNTWEVEDPRVLGPVYIGVYPAVEEGLYPFPHPTQGPVLTSTQSPDTYPYGGTTVGRFHFGCYQQTICKMVTGRFEDYADVLDFWENTLQRPLMNDDGEPVSGPDEYREWCYELYDVTSDEEIDFVGPLDFTREGDWLVAEFDILHTYWREGATVWGWVDMPSEDFEFVTCDSEQGDFIYHYSDQYYTGTNDSFVLNRPGDYIDPGDWVVDEPAVIDDPEQDFEITMGFHYVE